MLRWQDMTPAEVLDAFPALSIDMVAYVTSAYTSSGELDRRRIIGLVKDGELPLIDKSQKLTTRWTVWNDEVRNFLQGRAA